MKTIYKEVCFTDKSEFPLTTVYYDTSKITHKVPNHFHEEVEIIYIEEGAIIYEIDSIPHEVQDGSIVIFPPNSIHCGTDLDYARHKSYVFTFNLSMLDSSIYDFCTNKYIWPIENKDVNLPFVITKEDRSFEKIKNLLLDIHSLNINKEFAFELEIKANFFMLFSALYKNNLIESKELTKKEMKINSKKQLVFSYIHDNYGKDICRNDLVNLLNMSEAAFTKFFKEISGQSFVEYLGSYRLIKSAQLLVFTNQSITNIALSSGFQDLSYFIKSFNKKMGISPREYRKIYGRLID